MANDTEKRITAKMVLDSSGFNSSLQGVNQQLKIAQSELKASSAQVGVFGKETDKLKVSSEGLSKQIELQRQKVDIYKDSIEKSTQKLNETIKVRDTLKVKLQEETAKYNEAIKLYGKESEEAKKAKESVDKLTEEYKKKEKQVESNAKTINNYTTNMNKADAELSKLQGELKKANTELDKSNNKWIQASTTLKESSEKLKKTGETVGKVGDGFLKLSAPLVAAGAAGSIFAMDFEDGMAKISTVADTSKISIGELGKGVIDLSNMSGEGFETIQDGLYDTISSGVKAEDSLNFLTVAVKAAKGGFTDTATSVDGLTSVLNAYGLETKKATGIANQMFIAQNLGKTTFGQMSQNLGNVIPTSAALKVKTEELFSSLAVLTANGIKTGEAVTGLKASFSNIIKPSKEAADASETLGIKFDAAEVSSKGWMGFLKEVKSKLQEVAPEYAKASTQYDNTVVKLGQLEKAGQKNSEMYKALKKSLKGQKEELDILQKANSSQLSAFAQLFGSVEGLNSVLTLTSDQGMQLYNESMQQMTGGANALDDAFNKVDNTSGNKLRKSLNELKNSSIKFGDAVAPMIGKVSDVIGTLTHKLEGMDKGTLESIAKVGMFTVALGGILKVGGGAISTVGNIAGGISKLSGILGKATVAAEGVGTAAEVAAGVGGAGGLAGLGATLGNVALAAVPWLGAGAAVIGIGYGINKAMSQEAVPAVDLFADKVTTNTQEIVTSSGYMVTQVETDTNKISESTKKAVGAYMKMDDAVTKSLLDIKLTSSQITSDTATQLTAKFNDMGNQIKVGMDKKYNDMYTTMQTFFKESGVLSDAEEAETLAKLKQNNEFQKSTVDQSTKEIKAILDKASAEKRELTSQERSVISNIQDNMKQDAVKSLSETEIESKVIMERLKGYSERITAEQAADTIKKANETRDKAVAAANTQYDKSVAAIIKMRDESHVITAEQAEKLLKNAEKQRKDSVDKAEEMKTGVVKKIKEMNPDIVDQVNFQTGTIMDGWDKVKKWWDGLWFPKKKMEVESVTIGNDSFKDYAGSYNSHRMNYTGNNDFEGGYTTLHEKGYELYDLPRHTKIYNHEASEDLVIRTAKEVARSVLNGVNNNNSSTQTIVVPVYLEGREIAKAATPYISNNLAMSTARRR